MLSACAARKRLDASLLPDPYLKKTDNALIYDASFQYKEFHASGLLVMKKIDSSAYQVQLMSKFGPGLMDFKLYEDSIHWIKTFDQLHKKSVENLIGKDFRLLLLSELDHPRKVRRVKKNTPKQVFRIKAAMKSVVVLESETGRVLYTENKQWFNPVKTRVNFEYDQRPVPKRITLTHDHVNMHLELELLKINYAEE